MKKTLLSVFVVAIAFTAVAAYALPALAQANLGLDYAANLGLQNKNGDVRDTAVDIIRYLMTFLGLIAVVIILLGGFRWMTANGNEDRIASAKRTIIAGAIGLIIILAAFAIVTFVIQITNNSLE